MRILDFADGFNSSTAPTVVGYPASSVTVTPTGNLAASNGQAALTELQGDIDSINAARGSASGIATLDGSGKVPTAQLPSIALVDVNVVANIAARDALTVQEGDVAVVTDAGSSVSKTYIYDGSSWIELLADGSLAAHLSDTVGAHAASAISVTPAGNLSSTEVQAALVELQTDVDGRVPSSVVDAKGDLLVASADNVVTRRSVGANGTFLKANSADPTGVEWGSATSNLNVASKTASFTATTGEDFYPCNATSGAITATLYTAVGNTGKRVTIKKTDSSDNAVTIDGDGSETIDGETTFILRGQYDALILVSNGTNWEIEKYYFKPKYLAATSAQFSGGGAYVSGEYAQMSGNTLALTPGSWELHATAAFSNSGTTPSYTYYQLGWYAANGANTTTPPASLSMDSNTNGINIYVESVSGNTIDSGTSRITVNTTTTVYMVPRFTATTVANARVTVYLYAERVG